MSRRTTISRALAPAATLLAASLAASLAAGRASAAPPDRAALTTRFTYVATVTSLPSSARTLNLWLPLPSDSALQQVSDIAVDSPVPHRITRESRYGNRMVFVHFDDLSKPARVAVSFTVKRREPKLLDAPDPAVEEGVKPAVADQLLLSPDAKVPLGGRYGEIADEVTAGKNGSLDRMRAIYDHTVATMQYDYKKESPKYAQGDVAFVCDYKKGNCSDLHSYIISLARSLKIPAYIEYGFPLTGIPLASPIPADGSVAGYHCWTWFKDPKRGWLPLDASDGRRWQDAGRADIKNHLFGNLVLERSAVALSRGRDITLSPAQKAGPLNNFIYPYAEADGQPVEAKWEFRYHLLSSSGSPTVGPAAEAPAEPSSAQAAAERAAAAGGPEAAPPPTAQEPSGANQDVQKQIDELRRIIIEQQRQIQELRTQVTRSSTPPPPTSAPPKGAPPAAPATTVPSREAITFYGFLRLDAMVDNGLTNNVQGPQFVLSPSNANAGSTGNRQISFHPRLTRLGMNFTAPTKLSDWTVSGKLETDWQNGGGLTAESRPLPRIRHAYINLQRGATGWLFGQTWDVISPLFPSPNDDTLMWNAGNLGDRRPQVRYTHEPASGVNTQIALGLTGAIDAKDLDANGVRDGEDSGAPNIQARIGWKDRATSVGIWGHRAWERTTKLVAGSALFNSYSVGLDLQHQFSTAWDLKGEFWTGKNLSDFRGGIGQGIDPATGTEIRAHGGWGEVGYTTSRKWRIALGYTEDRATDRDVPAGGRLKNYAYYLANRWRLGGSIDLGLNYLYWSTQYKGLSSGIDNRINGFIQHSF